MGEPVTADDARILFAQVLGPDAVCGSRDDALANIARLIP
jgi:hypothetical protein